VQVSGFFWGDVDALEAHLFNYFPLFLIIGGIATCFFSTTSSGTERH
jgi:hypothetical protein